MADTTTLEKLNAEIVQLVDELRAMQTKQEQLRELIRQRTELEQQLLGMPAELAPRGPGRKRTNAVAAAAAAD